MQSNCQKLNINVPLQSDYYRGNVRVPMSGVLIVVPMAGCNG